MKAYMEKKNTPRLPENGPYCGHPVRLTIGMIVKNEEKTLDRCLRSLQPLRKAVESELIITDTGSTDRTVEIAQKYTDRILHFEWCGDFSAARNTGLNAANGEWFLFLDGDEWFENTDDLIRFFTSGECDKYNSATYIQRNYSDDSGKQYNDYHTLRLSRMYPGIHFRYIIHEDLGRPKPVKFLNDFVHHYGYVFHSMEERNTKLERNRQLLEQELAEDPDNVKAYSQLAMQYLLTDGKRSEEYCELGLQAERKNPDHGLRVLLFATQARGYFKARNYRKLLEFLDETAQEFPKDEIFWLEFHYLGQAAGFHLNDYKQAEAHGKAYLEVWEKYRANKLNQDALSYMTYSFILPASREQVIRVLAQTALNQDRPDDAEEAMGLLKLAEADKIQAYLRLAVQVCRKTGDWMKLAGFYRRACTEADGGGWLETLRGLEDALRENLVTRDAAACAVAGIPEDGDPYVRLCRLRRAESEENKENARKELGWFSKWDGNWNPILSDVLFFAMKEKVNLMPMILRIDSEDLKYYVSGMQGTHSDFPEVTKSYCETYSYENLRGLYWSVCLREKVLLQGGRVFDTEEDETRFFEAYARQTAQYVKILYRPELLASDRISVLPRAHRFGYYMGLAFSARDFGDGGTYLSNLRLALKAYSVMERQITLLLKQFEREEKLSRQKADEFRVLAKQVKERIRELIEQGDLKNAGQVTSQLAALLPNDPDVVRFRTLTHTEPDMKELAAHLPQ